MEYNITPKTAEEMVEFLMEAIREYSAPMDDVYASLDTFEDDGISGDANGLVVKLRSGPEFHITVVKTRELAEFWANRFAKREE